MLSLIRTAALSAALLTPPSADTQVTYRAVIAPEVEAPTSFSGANGLAAISIVDGGLSFGVSIVGVRHITNVAIVDEGRAVELYSAGDSRGDVLHIEGEIPADQVETVTMDELRWGLANGRAKIEVFTINEPGGLMEGALTPMPSVEAPAVNSSQSS
jgi:hypothetical protein